MTQVKIFLRSDVKQLESEVNKFLEENDGQINVKDIKYTGSVGYYSAMIIYETIR